MGDMTLTDVLAVGRDIGVITGLLLILVGGKKKWWVWGWTLTEVKADLKEQLAAEREEKEEWKQLALRNLNVADRAVNQILGGRP